MTSPRKKTRIAVLVLALLTSGLIFFQWRHRATSQQRANKIYLEARLLSAEGQTREAEQLARQALELDPSLFAAYRLAAECAASRQDYEQALEDLSQITEEADKDWLVARQQSAGILHQHLHRFRDAERAYLDVLAASPDDVVSNNGYARLLGLCGRRSDAIPHVLRLIRAGEETDLLILFTRESGQLNDPETLEAVRRADPADPNPLLGQAQAAHSAQIRRALCNCCSKPRFLMDCRTISTAGSAGNSWPMENSRNSNPGATTFLNSRCPRIHGWCSANWRNGRRPPWGHPVLLGSGEAAA